MDEKHVLNLYRSEFNFTIGSPGATRLTVVKPMHSLLHLQFKIKIQFSGNKRIIAITLITFNPIN